MVRRVEVRRTGVVLTIDYPGYTDRRERRIRSLPDPDAVVAVARMGARRPRRAAGYLSSRASKEAP